MSKLYWLRTIRRGRKCVRLGKRNVRPTRHRFGERRAVSGPNRLRFRPLQISPRKEAQVRRNRCWRLSQSRPSRSAYSPFVNTFTFSNLCIWLFYCWQFSLFSTWSLLSNAFNRKMSSDNVYGRLFLSIESSDTLRILWLTRGADGRGYRGLHNSKYFL